MAEATPNPVVIEAEVIEAMRNVFDPEIPVNIYELGLIYEIKVSQTGAVAIRMTLTAPSCPAAQSLPGEVQTRVKEIPGVTDVSVDVVWEPPWDPSRMTEAARLQLGMV
jgi:FeS assembly SUF system protein